MVFFIGSLIFLVAIVAAFFLSNRFVAYDRQNKEAAFHASEQKSNLQAYLMLLFGVAILVGSFAAGPYINLWQAGLRGQAILAEAVGAKQAKVEEALAERDSAIHLSDAEKTRAEGVKEANRIVADGLGGPDGYLRYLYIQSLKAASEGSGTNVIYVATEAGIPSFLLEAHRLKQPK